MPDDATDPGVTRVLVPIGMLGGGIPAGTVERGIELGADIIAIDGGSTDSGPHYLGTATAKTARSAVARDLNAVVPAAAAAGIPVVIGSCGTAGTDAGVEWVHDIAAEVAGAAGIHLRVARLYSEQEADHLETLRVALTDVDAIAERYAVSANAVKVFRLPNLHAIKVSFPRPSTQGGAHDRDMHAGQQYVPLLDIDIA